jgi:hypothetical protein
MFSTIDMSLTRELPVACDRVSFGCYCEPIRLNQCTLREATSLINCFVPFNSALDSSQQLC